MLDSIIRNEGNIIMSPSSYVFSSSPPNRSKRDDCSQQDPAGVLYEMRTKADAGKRCDKLMWVRRTAHETESSHGTRHVVRR